MVEEVKLQTDAGAGISASDETTPKTETQVDAAGQQTKDAEGSKDQGTPKQGTEEGKKIEVTVDVLRAFREEIKGLKEQNQLYSTQLKMAQMASQTAMPNPTMTPQGAQIPARVDGGEVSFDIADDDVVTGAELKKIVKSLKTAPTTQVDSTVAQRLAVIELSQQDPNWQNTIKTYLPEMINTNPLIMNMLRSAANPLEAALTFAKLNPRYEADKKAQGGGAGGVQQDDLMSQIDKLIENANKPSGAHGAGGASGAVQAGDRFATMSDAEFDAHVANVIAGKT